MNANTPAKRPLAANILTVLAGLLGAAYLIGSFSAPSGQTPRWAEACIPSMMLAMGLPYVVWPELSGLPWPRVTARLLGLFFLFVAFVSIVRFLSPKG